MLQQNNTISAVNLAQFIVEKTDRNLFLTGKAGTGKTCFLKEIKEHTKKKVVVLAPTGIAAINAKAQTIHSFFKFSYSPFIPETENINSNDDADAIRDDILNELELIIIDEISMVRADLLDRIDNKLQKIRRNKKPFGGVQLLMIGDLFQLHPVVSKADKKLLDEHYHSNYYFYNSDALKDVGFETICLDKVYRQDDEEFVKILDKARVGKLNWPCINKLNTRYCPDFNAEEDSSYITMVGSKRDADKINNLRLGGIDGNEKLYKATISHRFPSDAYPVPENLLLKVGTQVMFAKNNYEDGYRNGTIGQVIELGDDRITVMVDDHKIVVKKIKWENIEYAHIKDLNEIREEVVGLFTQFPIKPAWAITVHKSQGLTFEKAVIDLPHTFESGQAYVAFSRCRSLDGIVLKRKVNPSTFFVDNAIVTFYNRIETNLAKIAEKVSYVPFEWEETDEETVVENAAIDTQLAENLKNWRLVESRKRNLRAFQILTNRTLNEIATFKPKNLEQLGYINGVGLSTLSKFGEDIIKIVNGGLIETTMPVVNQPIPVASQSSQPKQKSWEITYDMYCSGKSISEIAEERGLSKETIGGHLARYIESGDLDAHDFVSDDIINKVRQFKTDNPETEGLKPIFEALGGSASYYEIRIALLCL